MSSIFKTTVAKFFPSKFFVSYDDSARLSIQVRSEFDATTTQAQSVLTNHTYLSIVEHGASGLLPPHSPPSHSVSFGVEGIDRGAEYYRQHFYEKGNVCLFFFDD